MKIFGIVRRQESNEVRGGVLMRRYYRRGHRRGRYYRRGPSFGGDSATGCFVYFLLGIIAMPLLGLYLMLKKDASDNTHVLGGVLLIVGIIIWIAIAVHSGS